MFNGTNNSGDMSFLQSVNCVFFRINFSVMPSNSGAKKDEIQNIIM